MSWRRVPPVVSPVALGSLLAGAAAALGASYSDDARIRTTLQTRFGARDVVLTDSGTSALVLALRAAVPHAGRVALPGFACIDVIAAAARAGVSARLYDLEPETLSPDLDSVRRALSRGVDAIVVAPLYGYPVDMYGIAALAAEHGVPVVEDAAQAAGSELDGRRVGGFGSISILSFGRGKGTTGGSGGALLLHGTALPGEPGTRIAALRARSRGWRDVVSVAAQWMLARPTLYAIPSAIPALKLGEMVYHEAHEPRAISVAATRMLEWALAADATEIRCRRAHAAEIQRACSMGRRFDAVVPVAGGAPGYLRFAALDARGTAQASPGIGALRGYPIALDEHPVTRSLLAAAETAGAGARTLRDRLFTLPTHSRVTPADVRRLAQWLGAAAADAALASRPGEMA